MALDSKNNIKSVFIVPDLAVTAAGTKVTPGSIGKGKIVVTNVSNEVLDSSTTNFTVTDYPTIKIVKDRGANLPLQQLRLNIADVIAYSSLCHQAATEQVSFIGYNGTSGSITAINNNFYQIKLEHVPNAFAYGKRPANYKYGTYQSDSSATQIEISTGLVKSLIQNFVPNRTIDWRVFSEVVTNATRTAVSGAGTLTFTKYSKTVVASAATATSTFVAGDYIQIAAGNTNGVYQVVARDVTSGNLTLDYSFQGETTTITPGTLSIRITAADAAAATAWGIKILGIKQKYDVNRWRQYDKVRFNVFLIEFGSTGTSTTAAFDGVGVYEQAANDEYISWGDEGQIFVDQTPPLFREQDAVEGTAYNVAILGWLNRLPSLIGAGENKGSAIFYIEDSCSTQGEELLTVLDSWVTNSYSTIPAIQGICCVS
jgi:hypothetical protein